MNKQVKAILTELEKDYQKTVKKLARIEEVMTDTYSITTFERNAQKRVMELGDLKDIENEFFAALAQVDRDPVRAYWEIMGGK